MQKEEIQTKTSKTMVKSFCRLLQQRNNNLTLQSHRDIITENHQFQIRKFEI